MDVSFSVSMMLQSVNNMAPGIQSAQRMLQGLGQTVRGVAAMGTGLNPVGGWEDRINRVSLAAQRMAQSLRQSGREISEQGKRLQESGLRNTAEGLATILPIAHMAEEAGRLQMKQISMEMAGINRGVVGALIAQADELTKKTLFSKTEIADMYLKMRQSGMAEENIMRGSGILVQFAELEKIRRGTDGTESAQILAQMAERGGVLRDPNIGRWNEFLEIVNKVTTVTTAGLKELHESSKYLEPTAQIAGWNEKDMMWSQGISARFGLEGSVAGTDLKDMISRLNPFKWFKEGRPDQHIDAMQRLGWLTDVQSHMGRGGRTAYDSIGGSVMLNPDGTTKNMLQIYGQFAKSYEKYKDLPNGVALFAGDMHKVLGEQGEKNALLVAKNYEVITQMIADAEKVKPIEDQIKEYANGYAQSYMAYKAAMNNLEITAGATLLPSLTEVCKSLQVFLHEARMFTSENPGLVSGLLKAALGFGALKLALGVIKLVAGGALGVFGDLKIGAGWIFGAFRNVSRAALNLKAGFDLIRATGGGFWRSLWQGAQLAWPWLARIAGWFASFGGLAMRTALRVAAAWLVGLGPIGWAILALGGLFVAWETNFLGFQDLIKDGCRKVIDWLKGIVDKMLEIIGLKDKVANAGKAAQEMGEQPGGRGSSTYRGEDYLGLGYGADNTPLIDGGSGSDTFSPQVTITNNVSVNSAEEAGEYVAGSVPDKYLRSRDPAFGGV